jgi:hypothetical protein
MPQQSPKSDEPVERHLDVFVANYRTSALYPTPIPTPAAVYCQRPLSIEVP